MSGSHALFALHGNCVSCAFAGADDDDDDDDDEDNDEDDDDADVLLQVLAIQQFSVIVGVALLVGGCFMLMIGTMGSPHRPKGIFFTHRSREGGGRPKKNPCVNLCCRFCINLEALSNQKNT